MIPTFRWSRAVADRDIARVNAEPRIYVISDIHLGDGSPADIFLGKDRLLLDFLKQVADEGALLVVAGDAVDFSQAADFTPILRAHGKVLGMFSELGSRGRLFYILGNHDHDLRFYREVLRIPVVHGVQVGEDTMILHGYELDPVIGFDIQRAERRTRLHHLTERVLGCWIRLPLEHFPNRWNRLAFWLTHKLVPIQRAWATILDHLVGGDLHRKAVEAELNYWTRAQLGDPSCMFPAVKEAMATGPWRRLICGHSHLPGVVRFGDRVYANSGSWTFEHAVVMRVEGEEIDVRDLPSGRCYDDRLYRPLLSGELDHVTFDTWWRDNYMGFLRFRSIEEHLERKARQATEGSAPARG